MGRHTSWWMSCTTESARPEAEGRELGGSRPRRESRRLRGQVQGTDRGGPGLPEARKARTHLRRRDAPPGAEIPTVSLARRAPRVARQRCAPAGFRRASSVVSTPPCGVANSAPPMPILSGPPTCGGGDAGCTAVGPSLLS